MSDQLCIDNQPSGSTQVFKIKARLNIQTVSKLKVSFYFVTLGLLLYKDLVITDEAFCDQPPPPPARVLMPNVFRLEQLIID